MRVMVTGAAGGVGRRVVSNLATDCEVVAFDVTRGADQPGVIWHTGDICDLDLVRTAAAGCDAVVHLAGYPIYNPDRNVDIARVNILGTEVALEAAVTANVPTFVLASSICANAFIFWSRRRQPSYLPVDEDYTDLPDDLYGLGKLVDEQLATAYASRYGLEVTNLRLATVWDPDSSTTEQELSQLLEPAMDQDLEFLDLRWQYVDVRDVAQAFRLAVFNGSGLGPCNIGAADCPGGDWRVWLTDIYPDVPILKTPGKYVADIGAPLWCIDKARNKLGYVPRHSWREYPVFTRAWEAYLERRITKEEELGYV